MQIFIQKPGGEILEAECGTRIIIDLGPFKTLELQIDEQDFRGDTVTFLLKTNGKPYAKLVNNTNLVVGIKDVPADPHSPEAMPPVSP